MSLQFTYTVYKSKTFHEFTIYLQSTNLRPSMSLQILDHLPWVYNLLTVYKSQTFHEFTIYLQSTNLRPSMSLQFTYTVHKSKTFHEFTIYLHSPQI
jgi:hypothetical protein